LLYFDVPFVLDWALGAALTFVDTFVAPGSDADVTTGGSGVLSVTERASKAENASFRSCSGSLGGSGAADIDPACEAESAGAWDMGICCC